MKSKIKRFTAAITAAVVLTAGITLTASADDSVRVYVNDQLVGSDAKTIDGQVYVPLKEVGDKLGAGIEYNSESQTVRINSKENGVTAVINKVGPSVVGIVGKVRISAGLSGLKVDSMAFGTGVIIQRNGYIMTNAHVVKDMVNIIVMLSNGKAYQARLKAIDELMDLALIKIDKGMLTPAVLGDISDIYKGEQVIAIGTPLSLSLRNSATSGIISGLNRSIQAGYKFIQSDVAINGGNSGGPLVNMRGKVIGINSIKYIGYGIEGITFSIPIDTVKYAIDHFMKYGKIRRPYLGVDFIESLSSRYGLPTEEGLIVDKIQEDSPALSKDSEKPETGLMVDDELLSVNGVQVSSVVDLNEEMKKYLPGDSVELLVKRADKQAKIQVVLAEAP